MVRRVKASQSPDLLLTTLLALDGCLAPSTWCQGAWAYDQEGLAADPYSDTAIRRCLEGWTMRLTDGAMDLRWEVKEALNASIIALYPAFAASHAPDITRKPRMVSVNDKLGFEAVKAVVAHAIQMQKEPQP